MSTKPIALDLCCGIGGWAKGLLLEGWQVIGVDIIDFSKEYPGEFIRADLLLWEGWRYIQGIELVVASTPCDEFSRWGMPWTRKRNPPAPSLALYIRAAQIAKNLRVPIIQENVRAAQKWLGKSNGNCGPFHLWGDVPAILPVFQGKTKGSYASNQRAQRAVIPENLARHVARCFKTNPHNLCNSQNPS